jgi:hypothetical protein
VAGSRRGRERAAGSRGGEGLGFGAGGGGKWKSISRGGL